MTPVKALTIRQPYASLVMAGAKPYEFRTWRTHYRGPLWIHAAAALHAWAPQQWETSKAVLEAAGYRNNLGQLATAAILGVVDLEDCIPTRDLRGKHPHCGEYDEDMFALVLSNPRVLRVPYPARGKLQLWPLPPAIGADLDRLDFV